MSLYNIVHGENSHAVVLLAILGLSRDDVPRYRDCWWDDTHIVIHTRTGGGNRDYYDSRDRCEASYPKYFGGEKEEPTGPWNSDLRELPTFVKDEDDDFDSTYANFHFTVPEKMKWVIPQLQVQDKSPAERWTAVIERMKTGDMSDPVVAKAARAFEPIFEQITQMMKQGS